MGRGRLPGAQRRHGADQGGVMDGAVPSCWGAWRLTAFTTAFFEVAAFSLSAATGEVQSGKPRQKPPECPRTFLVQTCRPGPKRPPATRPRSWTTARTMIRRRRHRRGRPATVLSTQAVDRLRSAGGQASGSISLFCNRLRAPDFLSTSMQLLRVDSGLNITICRNGTKGGDSND